MMDNNGSDSDDDGIPSFLKAGVTFTCEEDESEELCITAAISDFCLRVESMWLHRDIDALQSELDLAVGTLNELERSCVSIALEILSGKFVHIIANYFPGSLQIQSILDELVNNPSAADSISRRICAYISTGDGDYARELRSLHCMLLGTACLELYCQMNYTGPELQESELKIWNSTVPISASQEIDTSKSDFIHRYAIYSLECNGDVAFPICLIPQALFVARVFLSTIADPTRASWKHGIRLSETGQVMQCNSLNRIDDRVTSAIGRLTSRHWRNARAAVIHLRLLQKQSYEAMPTLWKECNDMFAQALAIYGCCDSEIDKSSHDSVSLILAMTSSQMTTNLTPEQRLLATELWLEVGLCQHFFEFKSKGKDCFRKAQQIIDVETRLTSALGKRTKYQQTAHLQLYLFAKSNVVTAVSISAAALVGSSGSSSSSSGSSSSGSSSSSSSSGSGSSGGVESKYKLVNISGEQTRNILSAEAAAERQAETVAEAGGESKGVSSCQDIPLQKPASGGWEHAEWELGRKLVGEVEGGEEAAVREVMLDSQDGGAVENILIEGGPKFSEDQDRGGSLHPLDQAVLMSLCLDVSNSNPVDGLTNEEMYPYVERVMQQPQNWMVHSTALLQRSWLEFERRKTMDRALLQMQALLDQHTTKLTITQSTYKSIEESAPAEVRLMYLHSLVYPAQYELKRDLALKYLQCQVYSSALNYFKELEMWDEVVTCYQLMDKPQRAELVVRERLRLGETPYMLTALGDLTQSEDCYERAWILSNKRFARAKRTLARMRFDQKDYASCVRHMDEALAIHPLVPTAWYLKGLACMQLEDFPNAIQAFSRCVQQDMEIGEAWANIGAIYMRQGLMPQAHAALIEALKQKRDSWQVLENLLTCCLAMESWREAVEHMTSLLDAKLRKKSGTQIYKPELRRIVRAAITESVVSQKSLQSGESSGHGEQQDALTGQRAPLKEQAKLVQAVEQFLIQICVAIDSDPELWDIVAEFYFAFNVPEKVEDSRVKQFRALIQKPNWEKETAQIEAVVTVTKQLIGCYRRPDSSRSNIYAGRSLVQGAVHKCLTAYEDLPLPAAVIEMQADLEILNAMYNSMA